MRRLSVLPSTHIHFPFKNHIPLLSPLCTEIPKSRWARMAATSTKPAAITNRRLKKVVVIMGPTGCGKSKLSVDLATGFFPSSEIINSDKIQVHRGLDITTNKISLSERKDVPHHLLGDFDSTESHPEFTPSDFRFCGSVVISEMASCQKLPLVVGGSNSFTYALLAKKFNPELDVFSESDSAFCRELRYNCCFIWVDVEPAVLDQYLVKRVDDMLESGMFEELAEYFSHSPPESSIRYGLRKAIGVPEFESYFQKYSEWRIDDGADDVEKRLLYEEAVQAIKDNTCQLAKRQMGKIVRLRDAAGWNLNRVDATAAVEAAMGGGGRQAADVIWETMVLEPSVKIVKRFLME